jgi:hypothetical protein
MMNCFQFCFNFAVKFNLRRYNVVLEGRDIAAIVRAVAAEAGASTRPLSCNST